jgi:antitoxin component of MazEF toxin-antitoxin module
MIIKKKVINNSGSSYIPLPKPLIQYMKLQPGDEIIIEDSINDNGDIVITIKRWIDMTAK